MSLTPSTMLPLGSQAPAFSLTDCVSGQTITLDYFAESKAVLVLFICCHCPFVKLVETELGKIGQDYERAGLGVIAINSNDIETYPADAPAQMKAQAETFGFHFPYCLDATQQIAKAYRAACTPDLYLFDGDHKLVYRGQLDDARLGNNKPVTGKDLRAAIDLALSGKKISLDQWPATGCNIKWKPGNEPDYFG